MPGTENVNGKAFIKIIYNKGEENMNAIRKGKFY